MTRQLDLINQVAAIEQNRDKLITYVMQVSHEIAAVANNKLSLQLQEMIRAVARLSTSRSYPDGLDPVEWSVDEWAKQLWCGRSSCYKVLKMAHEAGAIRGQFGQLVIDVEGLVRWVAGEEPTALTKQMIEQAYLGNRSKGKRRRTVRRTDESVRGEDSSLYAPHTEPSAGRTDSYAPRIPSYISNSLTTDSVPVPERVRPADERSHGSSGAEADTVSGAGKGPVFLGDGLPDYLLAQPEIPESLTRSVDPLPAGELIRGAFAALTNEHLGSSKAMVLWFRRQLSAPEPVVTGSTEAHLITVMAVATYAAKMPDREVRRSRVGVFVHTLRRRELRRVLKYLPQARTELDRMISEAGDRLLSANQEVIHAGSD